jgi:hypothetical protein
MVMGFILFQMETNIKGNFLKVYNMAEECIPMEEEIIFKDSGLMEEKKEKDLCMHMEIVIKESGIQIRLGMVGIFLRTETTLKEVL